MQSRGLGPGPSALRTGLHNWAVMDMRFLVAWDSPSTAEINKFDHTRSRTWVVAATTRRPNHQAIWSHAGWAMSRYSTTCTQTQHIRGAIQPRGLCWLVIASQTARPPDQRRASGHTRTSAASSVEHLMRGLPRGVLASMLLPPPRRDRQRSAQSVPLRAQATPSRCKVVSKR